MIQFTNSVGVAPGTTTMTLGGARVEVLSCLGCPPSAAPAKCATCPPDPVAYYVNPPVVQTGWPSGVTSDSARTALVWDPYGTESKLQGRGLAGLGDARLGVGVTGILLGFAGVLGYGWWKRRHK